MALPPAAVPAAAAVASASPATPPALLSIGGRDGVGQRINGDYELLTGVQPGGRPCWLRRGARQQSAAAAAALAAAAAVPPRSGPAEESGGRARPPPPAAPQHGAGTGAGAGLASAGGGAVEDEGGPLYLFFNDMGYWTVASSPHAAGVQVLARSGPEFGVQTPDEATIPWVVFAGGGKGKPDHNIVCFRHDVSHQPPEALHVTGCRGLYGQLSGLYYRVRGVSVGSRPIFIKDGMTNVMKEEKKLMHFSQRTGRWLLSSLSPSAVTWHDNADAAAGASLGGKLVPALDWSDTVVLAKSPVAWTSMSPVHLLPKEPWLVLRELPPRLCGPGPHRGSVASAAASGTLSTSDVSVVFGPFRDLRVAAWIGGSYPPLEPNCYGEYPASPVTSSSFESDIGGPIAALRPGRVVINPSHARIFCIHLVSPQGLTDPFDLNGDYAKTSDVYGERSVYAKHPPGPACGGNGFAAKSDANSLYLFFDDISGRWQIAPEIGSVATAVSRSPMGWDWPHPPLEGVWQLRVPSAVVQLGTELGLAPQGVSQAAAAAAHFRDWTDLSVSTGFQESAPRTLNFGGESVAKGLDTGHTLAGDFGLLRERYGRRPVYRRAPRTCGAAWKVGLGTGSSPALYLFFEPRSGLWLVTTTSPLLAGPVPAAEDVPGHFGEVVARSGPSWEPFTPDEAKAWEVFDLRELKSKDLVERGGQPPDSYLSSLLAPAPWMRLHALGFEDLPKTLNIGGFPRRTQALAGLYELMPEQRWNTRPAWQRVAVAPGAVTGSGGGGSSIGTVGGDFPKFLFFWPETGHWVIGPELHSAHTALARNGPCRWAAESPDRCAGRWSSLNGASFQEDPQIFCRRHKSSAVDRSGLLSPRATSPAGSPQGRGLSPRRAESPLRGSSLGGSGFCWEAASSPKGAAAAAAQAPRQRRATMPATTVAASISTPRVGSALASSGGARSSRTSVGSQPDGVNGGIVVAAQRARRATSPAPAVAAKPGAGGGKSGRIAVVDPEGPVPFGIHSASAGTAEMTTPSSVIGFAALATPLPANLAPLAEGVASAPAAALRRQSPHRRSPSPGAELATAARGPSGSGGRASSPPRRAGSPMRWKP